MKGEQPLAEYDYPSLRHATGFLREQAQIEIKGREAFKILEGLIVGLYNISNVGLIVCGSANSDTETAISQDYKGLWSHAMD